MSRILLLGNAEIGIMAFRRELIEALIAHNFEVVVGFPFSINSYCVQALGCRIEDTIINRHGTSIVEDGKLLMQYIHLIRKYRPQVVLMFTIKPNIYASLACQFYGVPYINNVTGLGTSLQGNTVLARLVVMLQKIAYRKSACVFFQNSDNLKRLSQLGVIHQGLRICLLPGSGVNLTRHRYEPFSPDDGIIRFVTVARIQQAKGYDILFPVAGRIKGKYPHTEFHVVGWYEDDAFKDEVERLVQEKIIVYHGEMEQEELHCLISRCNCLIHPTHHEGMSNVCLEAAATGRPIIASDIPGCRETFDEGISGYGFKVKDANVLYEVLEKFIHTPIEKQVEMGRQGRLKMEREFDRRIVVNAYLEEIEKIIRKAS